MSRPFRHTFIVGLVALATGLAAVGGWRYARASAPVNGPIILISVDALRSDHLPIYGYREIRTPAIDALAADGVVFERAYSHTPQTLPAHVSLLTGRLPFETGVRDNVGFVVKDEERLLPEMLRDRGFATGAVVSSYELRRGTGVNQGFTFFDDDMASGAPDSGIGGLWRSGNASEHIAERWLESTDTSRLFLFLHLYEPAARDAADDRVAEYTPYDAAIVRADEAIGRLMRYLKAHQLYDRSTIILVSDHGEGLGDHGEQEHGLLVYDEALRVPLVIKRAAAEGAGRRVTVPVQHIDLVPTILDLAKAPASDNLSGHSLTPVLEGRGQLDKRIIYSESMYGRYHFGWSELTTVTDGRYRYIRAPGEELYDTQIDPGQLENLAAKTPDEIPAVMIQLRLDLKQFGAGAALLDPVGVSAEERERLEALGSVGNGAAPAEPLIDPKDKLTVLETYRSAVRLGVRRQWQQANDLLRATLRAGPNRTDLWSKVAAYAALAGKDDEAAVAYKRVLAIDPDSTAARLGAAASLLRLRRLEEARQQAALVVEAAFEPGTLAQASAHALLVEVALARGDAGTAREEALLVAEADSRIPMPDYVEARLLYDHGRLASALPFFDKTSAEGSRTQGVPPIAELHYYMGDALSRLKRYPEAERAFLEELKFFPQNSRARIGLVTVYRKTKRLDEAGEALSELTRVSPTSGNYQIAAQLWETLGELRRAAAVRAEARRLFEPARQSTSRAAQ